MKPLSFLLGAAVGWWLVRWLSRPVVRSWPVADGGVTYEPQGTGNDTGFTQTPTVYADARWMDDATYANSLPWWVYYS